MTTDFRLLCAELADSIELLLEMRPADAKPLRITEERLSCARAALAEPQPEPPTKAELKQLFDDQSGYINDEQVMWWSDFYPAARAVLARWGS